MKIHDEGIGMRSAKMVYSLECAGRTALFRSLRGGAALGPARRVAPSESGDTSPHSKSLR